MRPIPSARRSVFLLGCLLAGGLGWTAPTPAQDASRKAAAEQQLNEVRGKVAELSRQQNQTAAQRAALDAKLARQTTALAAAARALHDTDTQLAAKQHDLDQLERQHTDLQATLDGQRAAIAALLRATYALGRGSDLRVLLGDQDVARIARALAYSKYFQQDRVARVQQLMADLSKLQDLEQAIASERAALQATRAQQQAQAQALEKQRDAQRKLVAQVAAQYQSEAERLAALKENERSLDMLVAQLQKAIDDAARAAAERARQQHAPPPTAQGPTNIRGNLPWPAAGPVRSYGNGVLIGAARGSAVHAVAAGTVLYAGFLRGYGMLLILDNGGGWWSMYGNNETLLHARGDRVSAGEEIGTASQVTGINTGVYFELRHDNRPVDPRRWLAQHR